MKFTASLFWAVVAFAFLLRINGGSCCPEDEKSSLLHFKADLHDPSGRLDTWNSYTNCCEWKGIECDPGTGHVIRLDLRNPMGFNPASALRNLNEDAFYQFYDRDVLPPVIKHDILSPLSNLRMLEHLDLSYNAFLGVEVPLEMFMLKKLQYLSLSNAGFAGEVPRDVGNMSALQYLDLSTDYFLSSPSISLRIEGMRMGIGNLRGLEELLLDGVDMRTVTSDDWGKAISAMPNLRRLQMSNCELSGPIPPSIGNLTALTHLQLAGNPFFSPIPTYLQHLPNLISLKLGDCYLNGSIPSGLLNISKLQEVDLSANEDLEGKISSILPQHSASLNTVVLSATIVGGRIPDSVANISSLTVLDLSNCLIEGTLPPTIANLTELLKLDLSMNRLTGNIPAFGVKSASGRSFPLAYVDLSYNQLKGSIPPMLLPAFRNLRYVDLSRNQLSGSIRFPADNLNSLSWLDLSSNGLTGKIPSMANLKSLVKLDLSNNSLTGTIPPSIGQLRSLNTLDLSNNELEGAIPINISQLSKMNVLSLCSNRLTGNLSQSHLHNLSKLTYLDISNNMLSVKVSPIWIPKNSFTTLKLSSCNMEGELPAFLITQYALAYLDLSKNRLAGNIPLWLWGLPELSHLNLSYNQFAGDLPSNLMEPKKLKVLNLRDNNLQGLLPLPPPTVVALDLSQNQFRASIPDEIGKLHLSYLSLSENNLSGSIPPRLCEESNMQILDLSHNRLQGKIPASLGHCPALEVLNLQNNYLEGELPAEFGNMTSLQTLKVGHNRLNGSVPTLVNCKTLQILDVGHNYMTGNISNWIEELPSLKILVLRSNRFEGGIPIGLTKLPFLQILDLSMNSFSGEIPDSISKLKAMANDSIIATDLRGFEFGFLTGSTYVETIIIRNKGLELEYVRSLTLVKVLDLSSNNIAGPIPQGLGSLVGLISLNISRNQITGPIPNSLGNMIQLESLDLSQNQLSGKIPTELSNLTYLSFLNLSHNNLKGTIPQGGQFLTFDVSSFSNNSGLCGHPLNVSCSPSVPTHERTPQKREVRGDKEKGSEEIDVFIVLVGASVGVGVSIIVAPLLFLKKRRRKFFASLDRILIWAVDFTYCFDELQIADMPPEKEDTEQSEEIEKLIRFCVRCTQIDKVTKRIVHTKCIC